MIEFLCGCDERTWSNEIVFISQYPDKCEFQLRYDGNEIEVIVGKSTKGNWICIPLMKSGLELAYFKDEFWDKSALSRRWTQSAASNITIHLQLERSKDNRLFRRLFYLSSKAEYQIN